MSISAADVKRLREKTGAGMLDCQKALKEANGNFEEAETILKKMGLAAVAKRAERGTAMGRIFTAIGKDKAVILELGCETDFVALNADFVRTGNEIATLVAEKGVAKDDPSLSAKVTDIAATIKENLTLRRVDILPVAADEVAHSYLHGDASTVGVVVKFKLSSPALASNDAVKTFMRDCALHAAAFAPQFLKPATVPAAYIATQKEIFVGQVAGDEKLQGKPDQVIQKAIEGKLNKHLKEICYLDQPFVKDDKKSVAEKSAEIGKAAGGSLEIVDYRVFRGGEAL